MKESKGDKKCHSCYWWQFVNWYKGNEGHCAYPYKECPRKKEEK